MSSFARMPFLRRIFVFVFLGSILYTVFTYVPILEEEVCSKKQAQTSQSDNSDGGAGGGEDDTNKAQEDLFSVSALTFDLYDSVDSSFRRYLQSYYIPPLQEHHTPPPRFVA